MGILKSPQRDKLKIINILKIRKIEYLHYFKYTRSRTVIIIIYSLYVKMIFIMTSNLYARGTRRTDDVFTPKNLNSALAIIKQIEPGDKIGVDWVSGTLYIQSPSFYTSLFRSLSDQSRKTSDDYIKRVLYLAMTSNDQSIIDQMDDVFKGLLALHETYRKLEYTIIENPVQCVIGNNVEDIVADTANTLLNQDEYQIFMRQRHDKLYTLTLKQKFALYHVCLIYASSDVNNIFKFVSGWVLTRGHP